MCNQKPYNVSDTFGDTFRRMGEVAREGGKSGSERGDTINARLIGATHDGLCLVPRIHLGALYLSSDAQRQFSMHIPRH